MEKRKYSGCGVRPQAKFVANMQNTAVRPAAPAAARRVSVVGRIGSFDGLADGPAVKPTGGKVQTREIS
jgi:hypothetical protein